MTFLNLEPQAEPSSSSSSNRFNIPNVQYVQWERAVKPRGEARRGREGIQARCRPGMRDSTAQYFGGAKLCYD